MRGFPIPAAGLLACAIVLAGCGAPMAQPPDSTPQEPIDVTNGTLSVDPNVVFDRVQTLQGSSVDRPSVVRVFNSLEGFQNQSSSVQTSRNRRFYTLAGMTNEPVTVAEGVTRQKNGYVTGFGSIVLYIGENATRVDELLLTAHEFTHYVQLQSGRQEQLSQNIGGVTLTDRRYVLRSLLEGGAVVTTDAYLAEYANTTTTNSEMYTSVQAALPDGHVSKYENGKYVNGDAYMDSRSQTPADLSAVYENPPQTSEQLLHGLDPEAEPPVPLTVRVETGRQWVTSGTDRMGEAFVRTAMESAVGESQAVTAAAGWGNDTVRLLRPADGDGETAYVWVLRWDDAANQTEFQTAYERSLDHHGTETGGIWNLADHDASATLSAPTDRISVVAFGPESLVEDVTVTGDSGTVSVSTP